MDGIDEADGLDAFDQDGPALFEQDGPGLFDAPEPQAPPKPRTRAPRGRKKDAGTDQSVPTEPAPLIDAGDGASDDAAIDGEALDTVAPEADGPATGTSRASDESNEPAVQPDIERSALLDPEGEPSLTDPEISSTPTLAAIEQDESSVEHTDEPAAEPQAPETETPETEVPEAEAFEPGENEQGQTESEEADPKASEPGAPGIVNPEPHAAGGERSDQQSPSADISADGASSSAAPRSMHEIAVELRDDDLADEIADDALADEGLPADESGAEVEVEAPETGAPATADEPPAEADDDDDSEESDDADPEELEQLVGDGLDDHDLDDQEFDDAEPADPSDDVLDADEPDDDEPDDDEPDDDEPDMDQPDPDESDADGDSFAAVGGVLIEEPEFGDSVGVLDDEGEGSASAPGRAVGAQRPRADEAPLALYRRYRPETFAEVIGQEHVTEPLMRALENNRVNHAYLFSGPRGCGKTTSARILARALNCEQGPTPTPCGVCQSCRDLARGGPGSIDVIEIDAASHGGVDDARDLRERAFFAPVNSRYKIYIVDEAHMVTPAGFNAMLKLVEEPPPHVKFVFATTEPEKVIGTIRSRTHHYPFRLVPPKVLTSYLGDLCEREGVAVEPSVLPLVVRAGAGSVRDSLSVLDQLLGGAGRDGVTYAQASALLGYTPDSLLDAIMDAFAAGDAAEVFATIDKVIEVGQDPRRFAEDLLRRLRDLVIVAAVPDAVSSGLIDVAPDQADRLAVQAAGMGRGELTRAAEVIATGLTDMRGTTAPRLHLELMCSRVLLPGADIDGRGIHARLDRLERRVAASGSGMPALAQGSSEPQTWNDVETARPPASQERPSNPHVGGQGAPVEPQRPAVEAASTVPDTSTTPSAAQRPAGAPPQNGSAQNGSAQNGSAQNGSSSGGSPVGQRPAGQAQGAPGASQPTSQPPMGQPTTGQPQPGPSATGQRPAGQRPAGQRPAGMPPAGQRPTAAAPAPSSQGAPRQGGGATLSAADLRREWPRVLDAVKSRRRFAWILLSQNAQVVDLNGGVLTLGFASQGARDNFVSGGSHDVLRDCLVETLMLDVRIDPIISNGPGGAPSGGAPSGGPGGGSFGSEAPSGFQQGGAGQGASSGQGSPAGPSDTATPHDAATSRDPGARGDAPASGGVDPRTPAPSNDSAPAQGGSRPGEGPVEAASPASGSHDGPQNGQGTAWSQQARQNIRPTSHRVDHDDEPPPDDQNDDYGVSNDDVTLDETSESATDLIARHLGAEVIADEPL